jgi:phospholipid/cholesterol/gamma-HCH transport system permease protein
MYNISKKFINILDETGAKIIEVISFAGYCIALFIQSMRFLPKMWEKRKEIIYQMYVAGVKSFLMASVVALFTGMILSLQTGIEMRNFGQASLVGRLVIATLTREMAPFISAIVLIASVGSTIAAEISTMKVSEEIDALEMMSISPLKFLVMPRIIALAAVFPLTSVYFTFIGTFGGGVVANYQLDVPWPLYYQEVLAGLHFKATYVGLLKSFVFGIVVAVVSSAHGLIAKNGAIGVGHATRSSVIASFLLVLVIGYYITSIFFR